METPMSLPLPMFSGRMCDDWSSHETRIKAWLSVCDVPLWSRSAADVLLLSLKHQAALKYQRQQRENVRSFDKGTIYLRTQFDGLRNRMLARVSALNELETRRFMERGKRGEFVKDLISDVELLFLKADLLDDDEKRRALTRCFSDFPTASRILKKCSNYASATLEVLRWESGRSYEQPSSFLDLASTSASDTSVPTSSPLLHSFPNPPPRSDRTSSPALHLSLTPSSPSIIERDMHTGPRNTLRFTRPPLPTRHTEPTSGFCRPKFATRLSLDYDRPMPFLENYGRDEVVHLRRPRHRLGLPDFASAVGLAL